MGVYNVMNVIKGRDAKQKFDTFFKTGIIQTVFPFLITLVKATEELHMRPQPHRTPSK